MAGLGVVQAVGIADGPQTIYVATKRGLFRSVSPTYAWWSKQRDVGSILSLSPNPVDPQDLLIVGDVANRAGTWRSLDGGRTVHPTGHCEYGAFARSPQAPHLVYAGSNFAQLCGPAISDAIADVLDRSTDDGVTWTTVYTDGNAYDRTGGIGPIAIDPKDPRHVLAARVNERFWGDLIASTDGGQVWHTALPTPEQYRFPSDIAFDPRDASDIWTAWESVGLFRSRDGGRTWKRSLAPFAVSPRFTAAQFDPLTGRLYVSTPDAAFLSANAQDHPSQYDDIYAIDAKGHIDRFAPTFGGLAYHLHIMANGYLIAWDDPSVNCPSTFADEAQLCANPLSVVPLIGSGQWAVSPLITGTAMLALARVVGRPISPTTDCGTYACQVFEKGALAVVSKGRVTPVALVPRLMGVRSRLPVGGTTSSVTYARLDAVHGQRTPPPSSFRGGTLAVPGGTFVPYSRTLSAASGYIVPPYFWRYLTDARNAPDGWQRDIGLPLTQAVPATVTKGKMGVRQIMVQAFEDAVLTYDPKNPAPFRVERANVGADYAAAFPRQVR